MPFVGSLNRVVIIGNIANDPILSYTQQSNTPICKFTVATNRKFKTQAGELREEASFHRITVWGARAENLSKILTKGTKVYVEGRLVYTNRECGERTVKEAYIRASDIIILSRKKTVGGQDSGNMQTAPSTSETADTSDDILDLEDIAKGLTEEDTEPKASNSETSQDDKNDKNSESDTELPF